MLTPTEYFDGILIKVKPQFSKFNVNLKLIWRKGNLLPMKNIYYSGYSSNLLEECNFIWSAILSPSLLISYCYTPSIKVTINAVARWVFCPSVPRTDKKENQIILIYDEFRMEQLQSHIRLMASSYIGKYLRISSYIRKPFLIYDFATAPL